MEGKENAWIIFQRHQGKDKNNTWMRKGDLKGCTKALIDVVPSNSLYILIISSTILTKLARHHFVGCMVQEMRLSHIVSECGKLAQKEYK